MSEGRPSPEGIPPRFPLDQVVIGLLTTFIGAPICKTAFDVMHANASFSPQWWGGACDLGLGLLIGSVGLSFHWWRRFIGTRTRDWLRGDSIRWWLPIAVILAFVYVVGPDVYRRAVPAGPTAAPRMSGTCALIVTNELTGSGEIDRMPPSIVVVSGQEDESQPWQDLMELLNNAFRIADQKSHVYPVWPPHYERDIDAPKIKGRAENGFTIHGRNEIGNYLMKELSYFGTTRQTDDLPAKELLAYYHQTDPQTVRYDNIAWVEIGRGSPWKKGTPCGTLGP